MRKSNWLVIGIIIAASLAFLAMWFLMGFNVVDNTLDLLITVVWWVVVVAVCIGISLAESRRKRVMRTVYVAHNLLYNPEVGFLEVPEGGSCTEALQRLLQQLDYDFNAQCPLGDQRAEFIYVVRTNKFAQGGNVWTGEVVSASNEREAMPFASKEQLRAYIG